MWKIDSIGNIILYSGIIFQRQVYYICDRGYAFNNNTRTLFGCLYGLGWKIDRLPECLKGNDCFYKINNYMVFTKYNLSNRVIISNILYYILKC